MIRTTLRCRSIKTVAYDQQRQVLELEFSNKRVIRYNDIPEYLHQGLTSARSPSKFYHMMIRSGPYPREAVTHSEN